MLSFLKSASLVIVGLVIVGLVIGGIVVWGTSVRSATIPVEFAGQAEAIAYSDQLLSAGSTPQAWETRVFLPVATLQSLAEALKEMEYVSKQGKQYSDGRFDGAFVVRVDTITIKNDRSQLRPQVEATIRYEPDRETPWWSGATAKISLDAEFLPVAGIGETPVRLKIVPVSIIVSAGWNPFAFSTNKFISEALARQVLQAFADKLYVQVPPLAANLDISIKIDNREHSKFDKEGGYDLVTRLNGPTVKSKVSAAYPLVTSTGIWVMGGLTPAFSAPPALPESQAAAATELQHRKDALALRLRPFETQADQVEVRISNRPIMELIGQIAGPPANPNIYQISLSTENAAGVIANANVLKDNTLGDIGVTLTPQHAQFASGNVMLGIGSVGWAEGKGLSANVDVKANVSAAVHYHISTGKVGGGVGNDTTIEGSTAGSISLTASIAKVSTPAGDAIILQPTAACSRIAIDVYSGAALVNAGWIKIGRLGVRVKRNVGGGQQAPIRIMDSLPRVYPLVERKDKEQPKQPPREFVRFAHSGIELAWSIKDVAVEKDGMKVAAAVSLKPSDAEPGYVTPAANDRLKDALQQATPSVLCVDDQQLALLVDGIEIGPNNEIVKFVDAMIGAGVRVGEQTLKEADKLRKTPLKSLTDAPGNVRREGGKAVDWAKKRLGI
jgi:hypothetical protein